ncbi:helix-turn-helix domain-containing protein [Paenibacillus sp. FSL R5-0810]|uniref:helix-turn-helix domain-containing protein n=1 Tax=Paenibacillus sp. FSL R5-0810 TaxID=2921659 RepID=UPI0030F68E44
MGLKLEENIQKLLDEKEWSIYRLGKESGVSLTVLYGLGDKKQGPQIETVVKIADALGVTVDELVR